MPWGCLRFVIVVFPDHTHLLFQNIQELKIPNVSILGKISLIPKIFDKIYLYLTLHLYPGLQIYSGQSLIYLMIKPQIGFIVIIMLFVGLRSSLVPYLLKCLFFELTVFPLPKRCDWIMPVLFWYTIIIVSSKESGIPTWHFDKGSSTNRDIRAPAGHFVYFHNTQYASQTGSPSARQRNVIRMTFRWWADSSPILCAGWVCLGSVFFILFFVVSVTWHRAIQVKEKQMKYALCLRHKELASSLQLI